MITAKSLNHPKPVLWFVKNGNDALFDGILLKIKCENMWEHAECDIFNPFNGLQSLSNKPFMLCVIKKVIVWPQLTPPVTEVWYSLEVVMEGHLQVWSPQMTPGDSIWPQNSPRESFRCQWFWGILSCFIPITEKLKKIS